MKYISEIKVSGLPMKEFIQGRSCVLTISDTSSNEKYTARSIKNVYGVVENFYVRLNVTDIKFLNLIDHLDNKYLGDTLHDFDLRKVAGEDTIFCDEHRYLSPNRYLTLWDVFRLTCNYYHTVEDYFCFVADGEITSFKVTDKIRAFYTKAKVLS